MLQAHQGRTQYDTSATSFRSWAFGTRATPVRIACRPCCHCTCHKSQTTATPSMFDRVLGQLFVAYAGLPIFSPKCDNETCEKSRAGKLSLEYWFPPGVLSTILRLQLGYQPGTGTLFQLQTLHRVPDDSQCVNFALDGNIDGLKYLFSSSLASPRDVSSTRGYSLLRWALYGKQYATCQFLIHAGADADYRPIAASDNTPRIKASHFLLEGGFPEAGMEALRLITGGGHHDDFVDNAHFTKIHRIVLGLSMHDLTEELLMHPEDIDVQDSMGRTPLAWAAAKGDTHAVVTLLSHGADPNIIDSQISGALSNAAARGHTTCVRLLLEAGADPDPKIPGVEKKGSPFNVASRNATDVLLLKTLLDFGADIEACGVDGKTALLHASRTDNTSFVLLLLQYGANINAVSKSGATPLTTAITYNSHNVLRLILDKHEYSDYPRSERIHVIQTAALYGEIETLQILAATNHLRLKNDQSYAVEDFRIQLRQRPDSNEKLIFAFDELLTILNEGSDRDDSVASILEKGKAASTTWREDTRHTMVDEIDREDSTCFGFL